MTLRLSHRALVPVVAFAVLAGVFSTFMLSRLPRPSEEPSATLVRPKSRTKAPAPKAAAAPTRKPSKAAVAAPAKKQATKPVAKPAAKQAATPAVKAPAAPVEKAAPVPVQKTPVERPAGDPVGPGGLPLVVSRALAKNGVAVVALYDPRAAIDELALAEARAGAAGAKAGFVAINVFNERQSRPLANLLGVLENPSVLVYHRPDALFVRIDGFADRETVAQAAANARS